MSPAERRDRISELKAVREGQIHLQRFYLTVMNNPSQTQRQINGCKAIIEREQKTLAQLEDALHNAKDRYIDACDRTEEIAKEILTLENQDKIDKLMALTRELNGLGLDPTATQPNRSGTDADVSPAA